MECFVKEAKLKHLENEIKKELKGESNDMQKEFKTLNTGGISVGKILKSVFDLPKNIVTFIYSKIESFFVTRFMKRFVKKQSCKSHLFAKIKSIVLNKLFSLGICVFMTTIVFGK